MTFRRHGPSFLLSPLPHSIPGQRIGLMGGSFNPPHEGHAIVAATALRKLRLDQLWWIVTPGNPLKDTDGLLPQSERMALCRTFAAHPKMTVTGFESELTGRNGVSRHYTADTLSFLQKRYPNVRFVWIMGADNLATFHHWERWRAIARAMPVAVVDRPGWHLRALASPAAQQLANYRISERRAALLMRSAPPAWVFLTTRLSALSSTELRTQAPRVNKNTF